MADKGANNLSKSAVISDKITSVASDLKRAVASNTLNFGQQVPTPSNPLSYKVTHSGGVYVREGRDLDSYRVGTLKNGDICTVVELADRFAKVISPIPGWVSINNKHGEQLIRPCKVQRSSTTNTAFADDFERRFAEAKAKKDRGNDGAFDRNQVWTSSARDESPDDSLRDRRDRDRRRGGRASSRSSSDDSRDGGRRRDRPRDSGRTGGSGKADEKIVPKLNAPGVSGGEQVVPKLCAPGSTGGPAVLAPPPGGGTGSSQGRAPAPAQADLLGGADALPVAQTATSSAGATGGSSDLLGFDFNPNASTSQTGGGFDAFGTSTDNFDPFQSAQSTQPASQFNPNPMGQQMGGTYQQPCQQQAPQMAQQPTNNWGQSQQMAPQITPQMVPQMPQQQMNWNQGQQMTPQMAPQMAQNMGQSTSAQQQGWQSGWGFNAPTPGSGMVAGSAGVGGFGMSMQQTGMAAGNAGGSYGMPMQQGGGCSGCGGYTGTPNGAMQMATPYAGGGCSPQMGLETNASGAGPGESNLFNNALMGVSNLGFEQRKAAMRQ